MSNVCETRTRKAKVKVQSHLMVGEEFNDLPHESDGRHFEPFKEIKMASNYISGHFDHYHYCCKHCGSIFLGD